EAALAEALQTEAPSQTLDGLKDELAGARAAADAARSAAAQARADRDAEARERTGRAERLAGLQREREGWTGRGGEARERIGRLGAAADRPRAAPAGAGAAPRATAGRREALLDTLKTAEARRSRAADALAQVEDAAQAADRASRAADQAAALARESRAGLAAHAEAAGARLSEADHQLRETAQMSPEALGEKLRTDAIATPGDVAGAESLLYGLEREREALGAVNLRAEEEAIEYGDRLQAMKMERSDLTGAIARLRDGIDELNAEGRERLLAAFDVINENFKALFEALFGGGQAELKLVE